MVIVGHESLLTTLHFHSLVPFTRCVQPAAAPQVDYAEFLLWMDRNCMDAVGARSLEVLKGLMMKVRSDVDHQSHHLPKAPGPSVTLCVASWCFGLQRVKEDVDIAGILKVSERGHWLGHESLAEPPNGPSVG